MATTADLTCSELVELVTDYVEGALAAADRARFDAHVARCPPCVAYVEQLRTTIELGERLRADDVPDDAIAGLVRAFRGWRAGEA